MVAVVDTNCSPDGVEYIIPGNDDAMRAIQLYATGIADAVLEGKESVPAVAVGEDEFVELDENGNPRKKQGKGRPQQRPAAVRNKRQPQRRRPAAPTAPVPRSWWATRWMRPKTPSKPWWPPWPCRPRPGGRRAAPAGWRRCQRRRRDGGRGRYRDRPEGAPVTRRPCGARRVTVRRFER